MISQLKTNMYLHVKSLEKTFVKTGVKTQDTTLAL
jgi:hypothetical protein